jgi:hypothetical protein
MKQFMNNSKSFFRCIDDMAKVTSRLHVLNKVDENIRKFLTNILLSNSFVKSGIIIGKEKQIL